ncbi:hypothetical protein RJ639_041357 [Escallonia herrerae]|uniref:PUM-HD domain-containing protein n=1 Tax=Escallonia herrerae TaxID=1293975 RepID=A0AA88WKH7_9ASTE|nr:hypothetical protein RJ639_041357 [Escallonia herrerae]
MNCGMLEELNGGLGNDLESERGLLLRQDQRNGGIIDRERDLHLYRSGSAPPTVEGSLSAVGSLFRSPDYFQVDNGGSSTGDGVMSEEEIRSHLAYLSYYYSSDNVNPRLPPPLLSKEDWRVAQRFQAGGPMFGGIGDSRKRESVGDVGSSLFSMQPGLVEQKSEDKLMELRKDDARNITRKSSAEWLDRGLSGSTGQPGTGMGVRRKSFADILQEGLDQPASSSGRPSRPMSRNAFSGVLDSRSAELYNGTDCTMALQNLGSAVSHSFASSLGPSLSRNRTPEPHLVGRSPCPGLPFVGGKIPVENKNVSGLNRLNGFSSSTNELGDVAASLSSLSLSKNRYHHEDSYLQSQLQLGFDKQFNPLLDMSNGYKQSLPQQFMNNSRVEKLGIANYVDIAKENGLVTDPSYSDLGFDVKVNFPPRRTSSSTSLHSDSSSPGFASLEGLHLRYPTGSFRDMDFPGYVPGGHSADQKLKAVVAGNGCNLRISGDQAGFDLQLPAKDPRCVQYLQKASDYATHAADFPGNRSQRRKFSSSSQRHEDMQGYQKAYFDAMLAQQNQQDEAPLIGKFGSLNHQGRLNHQYQGNQAFGFGMSYQGNPMANPRLPSVGSESPWIQNEQNLGYISMLKSSTGRSTESWHPQTVINMKERFSSPILEEIKSNRNRSFELSDVVNHVIEFSTDQYGSRFIQQKLETAVPEEKEKIFQEIMPHARSLMTDVFGNYVIQKFFEHGTESQRKELANQLIGHVLPLSLQMYGCRVIQKALEVVDMDQQTHMVAELDGSVIKCVRDQNGNHVIQKCIECVPQDQIQFIVSAFFGQVVALSTHPYGCRVIQRVLEHCDDPNTQQIVMDEVLNAVCTLAQDQYGNYVIQHVLQHGKPHERSVIIKKLAGQIVKMSQQKFASNVVEKCLCFGGPEERQLLVDEMLGSTDENEPLQAMMKDPFGNYVVQKVLETCDDKCRDLIISRIKVHLNALKRYTYGKHIVSRIEKLITAGGEEPFLTKSSIIPL